MSDTTPCQSNCYNSEYMVAGTGVAVYIPCKSYTETYVYVQEGTHWYCHNGSGVSFTGGAMGFPTGNQEECGCND